MNIYVYVIVSLFLFSQEFTRIKWSENENEWRERGFFIFGWLREKRVLSLSFSMGGC